MLKTIFNPRAAIFAATILSISFFPAPRAVADAVILKNGERIDGKITSETDADVTIQYKVTASISDERVIKKAEVEKIEKTSPDVEAWAQFKDFKLGEDSMDPTAYTHYIGALNGFLTQYPQSPSVGAAKALLGAIEGEKKRMDAGEYKFDGKWLSKEEMKNERVQILGHSYLRQLKRFTAAGRLQDAIGVFEALEKQASGSAAFPEAVEITRRSLIALKQAAEANGKRLSNKAEEEKRTLEKLSGQQLSQTKRDLTYLRDTAEANVTALERSGVRWMPLSPSTEKSMSALSAKAGNELIRLNGVSTEVMKQSLAEAAKAKAASESGDLGAAATGYAKAAQLWAANELALRGVSATANASKAAAEKMEADKIAAADAIKLAAEAEANAKKAQLEAAMKAVPAPAPVAIVEDEPIKKETSFFSKPAAWIMMIIVLAFGALIAKVVRKFKDPSGNILDQ